MQTHSLFSTVPLLHSPTLILKFLAILLYLKPKIENVKTNLKKDKIDSNVSVSDEDNVLI